MKVCKTCV